MRRREGTSGVENDVSTTEKDVRNGMVVWRRLGRNYVRDRGRDERVRRGRFTPYARVGCGTRWAHDVLKRVVAGA